MEKENKNVLISIIIVIIVFPCLIIYDINKELVTGYLKSINWNLILILIIVVISLVAFFFIFRRIHEKIKFKKERKRMEEFREERLLGLLKTVPIGSSYEIKNKLDDLKERIESYPSELQDQYNNKIKKFYKKINERISQKEEEEEQEREKQRRREWEIEEEKKRQEELIRLEFEKKVNELYLFKKEKNSVKAMPLDKGYPQNIIREASWRMRNYLENKQEIKDKREEAIEYYKQHDIDSKPFLEKEWEEDIYAEIRNEIKEGKLDLKKKPEIKYVGEKFDKDFYRSVDLDKEAKLRAKAQGFKYTKGVELDGKIRPGGFYIRKGNDRESDKHFYLKHLFAELHDNMQMEHQIGDKRVDVALFLGDHKLGIEIETGANRIEQLTEKIPWLNKHFNQWIFVCPEELYAKYNQLVDHQKSFCFTLKRAKEFVLEKIPPEDHL